MSIVLEHISKSFGEHTVLNNFDYSFPDVGRFAFYGPSGCGKTTLLRVIGGLEMPDGGTMVKKPSLRMAWMFQENRLLPWFTVEKNLNFVTGSTVLTRKWLERIQLPQVATLYPDQLSGGMRRRVSLVRALAADGDVLLLDEPFKELDTDSVDIAIRLVDQFSENKLLLLVTHQLSDIEKLHCHVIHMKPSHAAARNHEMKNSAGQGLA